MSVSVLSAAQINDLALAGVPMKEMPILEDLARMLLPQSRYFNDVSVEAFKKYKEIKRRQAIVQAKKDAAAKKQMDFQADVAKHGDIYSMANGKIYGSKGAYRADLRAMGYVEVGNEDTVAHAKKIRQANEVEQKKQYKENLMRDIAKTIDDAKVVA